MEWLIKAVLNEIERQMARLYWNKYQKEINSPFRNTAENYENDTFIIRAYDWNDNTLPNFEYKDLKIWWYKHSDRGLYWEYSCEKHAIVPSTFLADMLDDCMEFLEKDFGGHEDEN